MPEEIKAWRRGVDTGLPQTCNDCQLLADGKRRVSLFTYFFFKECSPWTVDHTSVVRPKIWEAQFALG